MPRKTNINTEHSILWNFYVNPIEKSNYMIALKRNGYSRAASAGLRALMSLYITDKDIQNRVNSIINDFIIYKDNNKNSIL